MTDTEWTKATDEEARRAYSMLWSLAPGTHVCGYRNDHYKVSVECRVIDRIALMAVRVRGDTTFYVSRHSGIDEPIRKKALELMDDAVRELEVCQLPPHWGDDWRKHVDEEDERDAFAAERRW